MGREFRRAKPKCVLSPDQRVREGRVVRLAQSKLPSTAAALSFLNTHNEKLGARPLDLATASENGLLTVEAMITANCIAFPHP